MQKKFDDTNRGVMFKNADKRDEKDRDYSGELNVRGEEFWVSAWIKESKAGKKFLSFSIKPKNEAPAKPEFNDSVDF
jgi:hypothetical protein